MNHSVSTRSATARGLALLLALSVLSACVSVRTTGRRPIEGEGGGVEVRVYPNDDARRAVRPGPRFVVGELERRGGAGWQPVFRSIDPAWTVLDLPPGKYRVRFTGVLDEEGHAVALDDAGCEFKIRSGEVTELAATLDHVPTTLIAAGVVTAVVAAILLEDWFDDHDIPLPPPPPPALLDFAFHLTLDLALGSAFNPGAYDLPPVVTSHFPEDDALVAARSLRVIYALSEPLEGGVIADRGITVLAESAGLVAGRTSYDPQNWWLVWEPEGDLPRDDVLHVTLAADAATDLAGNELPEPVSFSFRTTP